MYRGASHIIAASLTLPGLWSAWTGSFQWYLSRVKTRGRKVLSIIFTHRAGWNTKQTAAAALAVCWQWGKQAGPQLSSLRQGSGKVEAWLPSPPPILASFFCRLINLSFLICLKTHSVETNRRYQFPFHLSCLGVRILLTTVFVSWGYHEKHKLSDINKRISCLWCFGGWSPEH